eukprot:TRINITY_DN4511_c1_g5_i3.p1 TRINITY_DN4511_c1_g5~~TRINITY_DN4511_c1_g5_i3.p1  ORF type:complete len:190 (+),score=22.09 TRINITY_DN4511_c1_g5_i3:15-584(+)
MHIFLKQAFISMATVLNNMGIERFYMYQDMYNTVNNCLFADWFMNSGFISILLYFLVLFVCIFFLIRVVLNRMGRKQYINIGTDQESIKREQREERYKEMLAKKVGHIEALQSSIGISQKQHILEMQKVKDSFKIEFSHLQKFLVKSVNDRIEDLIQFHLEQQSNKFELKLEDLDCTSADMEDKMHASY